MAIGKDPGPLKVQIFLERRGRTRAWVPYKILIGYGRGRQVIVDDRGEHLYDSMEFATREEAVNVATSRAWRTMTEKFPDASRAQIEWDILEEGIGENEGGPTAHPDAEGSSSA